MRNTHSPWKLNSIDQQLIELAFAEDLGQPFCDITTTTLFSSLSNVSTAKIISKHPEDVVICGLPIAKAVLKKIDTSGELHCPFDDGKILKSGHTLLTLSGKCDSLLMVERILLNFLQHLCAIATLTAKFVAAVKHTQLKILDTRKTLPGFRHLEKYAVHCGGGVNHRLGLYDAIMVKDTHIDFLGGMKNALQRLPDQTLKTYSVIIEVRTVDELMVVLDEGRNKVSRILLDNMSTSMMSECVSLCQGAFTTEASGNIDLDNIVSIAETGVDFASIGKLTHSAGNIDLSMKCDLR